MQTATKLSSKFRGPRGTLQARTHIETFADAVMLLPTAPPAVSLASPTQSRGWTISFPVDFECDASMKCLTQAFGQTRCPTVGVQWSSEQSGKASSRSSYCTSLADRHTRSRSSCSASCQISWRSIHSVRSASSPASPHVRVCRHRLGSHQRSPWNTTGKENWVQNMLNDQKDKLCNNLEVSNRKNQFQTQVVTDRGNPLSELTREPCKMEEKSPVPRRSM